MKSVSLHKPKVLWTFDILQAVAKLMNNIPASQSTTDPVSLTIKSYFPANTDGKEHGGNYIEGRKWIRQWFWTLGAIDREFHYTILAPKSLSNWTKQASCCSSILSYYFMITFRILPIRFCYWKETQFNY